MKIHGHIFGGIFEKKSLFKVQVLEFDMIPSTFYDNLLISDFSESYFHHLNTVNKTPDSAEIVKDSLWSNVFIDYL